MQTHVARFFCGVSLCLVAARPDRGRARDGKNKAIWRTKDKSRRAIWGPTTTSAQRGAFDGRRDFCSYDDRLGNVELHQDVFNHATWCAIRELAPEAYADCRAVWVTCLKIWAEHYDKAGAFDGLVCGAWLLRQLPDCTREVGLLLQVGLLVEGANGKLCMPYFPERRGRSGVRGIAVYKIDLTRRYAATL
jgi:hypothetical protein